MPSTTPTSAAQIVLAADRSPSQLLPQGASYRARDEQAGLGLRHRSTGTKLLELKLRLITTFCERMHEDAAEGHVGLAITGTI